LISRVASIETEPLIAVGSAAAFPDQNPGLFWFGLKLPSPVDHEEAAACRGGLIKPEISKPRKACALGKV
jgi:hypothetical protein